MWLAVVLVATTSGAPALRFNPLVDAPIIAVLAMEDGGAWALDRKYRHDDPCPCDPKALPWIERVAITSHDHASGEASNWLQYASIGAAPLLAALTDPGTPRDRVESGLIAVEAMALAGSTTQLVKSAVRRPRPHAWGDQATPPFDYHSFPSGHATAAFSAAASLTTLYALRHPHARATRWIAAGGFVVASATGLLRVTAGKHFPSDVAAGALIGSAIGVGVPLLHTQKSRIVVTISPDRVGFSMRFGSVR